MSVKFPEAPQEPGQQCFRSVHQSQSVFVFSQALKMIKAFREMERAEDIVIKPRKSNEKLFCSLCTPVVIQI